MDQYLIDTFDFTGDELKRLQLEIDAGLLQMETVVQAFDDEISTYNHFGWPVATQFQDGSIVLAYKRSIAHGSDGASSWEGRYVTSTSDLRAWSPPSPEGRQGRMDGLMEMHALATPNGERAVLLADRKCFLSDDRGRSWLNNSDNMPSLDGAVHIGPNLVNHEDFGLLGFYGQEFPLNTESERTNWVVASTDLGDTWNAHSWRNSEYARGVEPAAAEFGDGNIVLISREWSPFGYDGRFLNFSQHVYRHQNNQRFTDVEFDTKLTNIRHNWVHDERYAYSAFDTADVIFNPVSKRIEVIQSHRLGGGLGATGSTLLPPENRHHSLNVWSISPNELLMGSSAYRFDGTILSRRGYSMIGHQDSFHPGGSIVDTEKGWHHIFVYAGLRRAPSGIFRISRTLDTDA